MKYIKIVTVMLAFLVTTTACTPKEGFVGKAVEEWEGYYNISYTRFMGEHNISITVEFSGNVEISVATVAGRLDSELFGNMDSQYMSLYYGEDMKTDTSTIFLEQGDYNLKLYGKNHAGGVTVSYPAKFGGSDDSEE